MTATAGAEGQRRSPHADPNDETVRLRTELTSTTARLDQAMHVIEALERQLHRERALSNELMKDLIGRLGHLALRDGLTGLYNRRYVQDALPRSLDLCARHKLPLSVLFIDVDHFKQFNDLAGHAAGDELLRQLARLLAGDEWGQPAGRRSDVAARFGGEEFVLILPGTSPDGAMTFAERLRHRVATHPFPGVERHPTAPTTVTIGVASFPDHAKEPHALVAKADDAMFEAKRLGRNRIASAPF